MPDLVTDLESFLQSYKTELQWQHGQCYEFASTVFYEFLSSLQIEFELLYGTDRINDRVELIHVVVSIPSTNTTWDSLGANAIDRWKDDYPDISWSALAPYELI
jgi:hypothetical protein